jgi:hypothetical protein
MRPFLFLLVGAVLGGVAAAFAGPHAIHWYAQPPFTMGCDCGQAMSWAMGKLVTLQVVAAVAFAIAFLALAFVLGKRSGKRVVTTPTQS